MIHPNRKNSISKLRWGVMLVAIYSRCCVLLLQGVFNHLIKDHKSDGFISPANNLSKSMNDQLVHHVLSGLTRWDAQHFIHVSIYGYVYEHSLAFFPAFPMIIRLIGMISRPMVPFLNIYYHHVLISVCFNMFCYVCTARILFNLTYKEFKDEKLAYLSVIFFSISPASIFFSAAYSETLFSLLSFSVMYCDKLIPCCILIALSACTRSNGILNIGYPLYRLLIRYINSRKDCSMTIFFTLKVLFVISTSIIPLVIYQIYSYREFCGTFPSHIDHEVLQLASYKKYTLRGTASQGMCSSFIPYFYVQNQYWDVGFLHYFRWKQIPNFVIAFPILSYCTFKCFEYLYPKRKILLNHGLKAVSKFKSDSKVFPYVIHLCVLLFVCFFFVHIQVSTRLLCSSSPLIYWYFAKSLDLETRNEIEFSKKDIVTLLFSSQLLYYCLAYYLIGILLFSNFFPWT